MKKVGESFAKQGWILRSGGARGADKAFEWGALQANGKCEIFKADDEICEEAFKIASEVHPAWHRCNDYARRLHARNVFQVLGPDLETPTRFILCWTKDGGITGGTATAMRIATNHGIPVFNLRHENVKQRFRRVAGL